MTKFITILFLSLIIAGQARAALCEKSDEKCVDECLLDGNDEEVCFAIDEMVSK